MYNIKSQTITGGDYNQVYYPVGPNKDAYSLYSSFTLDLTTDIITMRFSVEKNSMGAESRRQVIYSGTDAHAAIAALEAAVEPGRRHMILYNIRRKAENYELTKSKYYALTDEEMQILQMGDAYLAPARLEQVDAVGEEAVGLYLA